MIFILNFAVAHLCEGNTFKLCLRNIDLTFENSLAVPGDVRCDIHVKVVGEGVVKAVGNVSLLHAGRKECEDLPHKPYHHTGG